MIRQRSFASNQIERAGEKAHLVLPVPYLLKEVGHVDLL
jgi:hypothetical protein